VDRVTDDRSAPVAVRAAAAPGAAT